jgi:His-Xaa-Ser system protein HxsD
MGLILGEDSVKVEVDTSLYPLDVIYSAAYVFLDRAYVLLDGDPKGKVIVELRPKLEGSLEELGNSFYNELLSYAFHKSQLNDSDDVRKILLQRALLTYHTPDSSFESNESSISEEISGDPEEVLIWEEEDKLPWEK